jgi:hypothetical protein
MGNSASPAAVVIFTATVDPVAAEEVCGIAWPSICRRGAPLERNDPDLWGDRLHRKTGPFSATSRPMADACLRNRVHYLDITGEIDVFEALAARDAEAKVARYNVEADSG